ncbi:Protein of unknown function DUF4449 [Kalmanozyma brasiliensis GHG001]|uniref:Uncharacterized protein n=1 Tax=Kalmanozyma brasiliensis (strain GHG001) TaxID=1365824 RepID=V5EV96_KALBG|nr:Protein of unknown function DUF4449 [Kalmanozyma brasiliensis GHG001]EST07143.1 Protein of unknown function DUF4449 [Kalmanozyma brasiliensis GHG001]
MSTVPKAVSQVSNNPAGNSVVSATDSKQKQADVDRSMRFFGVIQAFREGRYPDNAQIDDTLKYTLANSPVDTSKLSPDGKKLIQDIRELIETARQVVVNKNGEEEFQNFLYATRKADVANNVNVKAPITGADAKKDGETAAEALRTLVTLFLRNGELRKIVQDLGFIGRDMFADGAAKAAEAARPDEEKLNSVDQPAPDNEFHDDIPDLLKKKEEAKGDAQATAEQAKSEGASHAQDVQNAVDPNASNEQNKAAVAEVAKQKAQLLADKIPQKHKDLAKEQSEKAQNYLKEKFPEERRDQFYYRLKKVVVECQRHKDYQDAMDHFLNFFEQYKGHATHIADQSAQSAQNVRSEGNVATAETTFRRLIERFANGAPTQPIIDAVNQIYTDVANDPELKQWFSRLDTYVRKCLQEPGFIMKDEANTQARQLTESGKKFFVAAEGRDQGKYVPHKDALFREVTHFAKAMNADPLNRKLGDNVQQITKDLFLNSEGGLTFKPHLWSDIRDPILPELLSHVGLVPLPRIEYTDKQVDLVIENLAIDLLNILPSQTEMDIRNHFQLSQFDKLGDRHQHSFKLTLHQIQTDMRDVHFFFKKKMGFPKLNERGTADVFLGGKGLTVTVHLEAENAPRGRKARHIFTVKQVVAKVDKLKFAIRDSKHDTLIKVLRPLATGIIKKAISKAAEQGIRNGLEDLDRQLIELRDRIERNKQIEGKGVGDAFKDTFAKNKDESKPSDGTFKLATSKRNSILPNLGHPDGWVQKIDEKDAAAKAAPANASKAWYSPAFTIVQPGQKDPRNTASAKSQNLGPSPSSAGAGAAGAAGAGAAAGAAGLAGAGAAAAGVQSVSNAAAQGAGQPGQTASAYSTQNGTHAPGAIVAGTGATAINAPGTTAAAHDESLTAKAAPAISGAEISQPAQPVNPAYEQGRIG